MIPNTSIASVRPTSVLVAAAMVALPCGLGATATVAADLACEPLEITCSGFEPNWQFRVTGDGKLSFTDPENPGWETKPLEVKACGVRLPDGDIELTAGAPLNLGASITPERCVEPNDAERPYSVEIKFTQGAGGGGNPGPVTGTGCCR